MPTTRHEALRAIERARVALAARPDTATSSALAELVAAAEPFANLTQAVPPPESRR